MVHIGKNSALTSKKSLKPLDFDTLLDSALIADKQRRKLNLTGLSISSEERATKLGKFPPLIKVSSKINARNVGELRKWLANPESYLAPSFQKIKAGGKCG
jgi:hypothetical protein